MFWLRIRKLIVWYAPGGGTFLRDEFLTPRDMITLTLFTH